MWSQPGSTVFNLQNRPFQMVLPDAQGEGHLPPSFADLRTGTTCFSCIPPRSGTLYRAGHRETGDWHGLRAGPLPPAGRPCRSTALAQWVLGRPGS